jgi:hypothetical protein
MRNLSLHPVLPVIHGNWGVLDHLAPQYLPVKRKLRLRARFPDAEELCFLAKLCNSLCNLGPQLHLPWLKFWLFHT